MTRLIKQDRNTIRREAKRERERRRKEEGTYVYNRVSNKQVVSKWGIPYYERVKVETPWKLHLGNNQKFNFWINPETHQLIEAYGYVGTPEPHVSYKWITNMPFADISVTK